jgi:sulfoxide reductase catalytic subunit YedY
VAANVRYVSGNDATEIIFAPRDGGMLIKEKPELTHADVTPKDVYLNRRKFLQGLGIAGVAAVGGERAFSAFSPQVAYAGAKLTTVKSGYTVNEKITPMNDVTHYNNFYEFGSDKGDPAKNAQKFVTTLWVVSVEGEVKTPRKFSMDEILKLAPLEERIYRHRCVERWSIGVP